MPGALHGEKSPTSTLYLLIGPKGAGKTRLGRLLEAHLPLHFLEVERVWLGLSPGQDGWQAVEEAVDRALAVHPAVLMESLGVGPGFQALQASLESRYRLRRIRVQVPLETCLARVRQRPTEGQIPVPEEQVEAYNRASQAVALDWDLVLENGGDWRPEQLIEAMAELMARDAALEEARPDRLEEV